MYTVCFSWHAEPKSITLIVGDWSLRSRDPGQPSVRAESAKGHARLEKDVLGLEVAVDDLGLLEDSEGVEELGGEDAHEARAEPAERVLLDEFVEVVREELKDEAEVRVVDEGVLESEHVVLVVLVPLVIDLRGRRSARANGRREASQCNRNAPARGW